MRMTLEVNKSAKHHLMCFQSFYQSKTAILQKRSIPSFWFVGLPHVEGVAKLTQILSTLTRK
jgi:hypothetical protein